MEQALVDLLGNAELRTALLWVITGGFGLEVLRFSLNKAPRAEDSANKFRDSILKELDSLRTLASRLEAEKVAAQGRADEYYKRWDEQRDECARQKAHILNLEYELTAHHIPIPERFTVPHVYRPGDPE